jgi:hypothetical protein
MRRALSLVLALVLAVAVGAAIYANRQDRIPSNLKKVNGIVGAAMEPFFDDRDVWRAFARAGYDVQVDTAGSRAIATTVDLSNYDFAFPSGSPPAVKIQKERKISTSYVPFVSPMAIASFTSIAEILERVDVTQRASGVWTFDMRKYLDLVKKNTRWSELEGNTTYNVGKSILITSPDIATSNSAAMYAAIGSYVANDGNVVADAAKAKDVIAQIEPLFTRQGFAEESSEEAFEDYLSAGVGKSPLVVIYESQFIDRAAAQDGSIGRNMVLMYPDPDVVSKHTLVPLTRDGDAIGRLLRNNEDLQQQAIEHGFRTPNRQAFTKFVTERRVRVAPEVLNIIEPPTYETMEAIVDGIARTLHGAGSAGTGGAKP